ncbi:hypothetical protein HDV05_003930 [Chytridiales sp. JEL 0842]|nr:hypothetical protein HDV05_003930 [Chytridiales sp. JEL 0842]
MASFRSVNAFPFRTTPSPAMFSEYASLNTPTPTPSNPFPIPKFPPSAAKNDSHQDDAADSSLAGLMSYSPTSSVKSFPSMMAINQESYQPQPPPITLPPSNMTMPPAPAFLQQLQNQSGGDSSLVSNVGIMSIVSQNSHSSLSEQQQPNNLSSSLGSVTRGDYMMHNQQHQMLYDAHLLSSRPPTPKTQNSLNADLDLLELEEILLSIPHANENGRNSNGQLRTALPKFDVGNADQGEDGDRVLAGKASLDSLLSPTETGSADEQQRLVPKRSLSPTPTVKSTTSVSTTVAATRELIQISQSQNLDIQPPEELLQAPIDRRTAGAAKNLMDSPVRTSSLPLPSPTLSTPTSPFSDPVPTHREQTPHSPRRLRSPPPPPRTTSSHPTLPAFTLANHPSNLSSNSSGSLHPSDTSTRQLSENYRPSIDTLASYHSSTSEDSASSNEHAAAYFGNLGPGVVVVGLGAPQVKLKKPLRPALRKNIGGNESKDLQQEGGSGSFGGFEEGGSETEEDRWKDDPLVLKLKKSNTGGLRRRANVSLSSMGSSSNSNSSGGGSGAALLSDVDDDEDSDAEELELLQSPVTSTWRRQPQAPTTSIPSSSSPSSPRILIPTRATSLKKSPKSPTSPQTSSTTRRLKWADETPTPDTLEVHHDFADYVARVTVIREKKTKERADQRTRDVVKGMVGLGLASGSGAYAVMSPPKKDKGASSSTGGGGAQIEKGSNINLGGLGLGLTGSAKANSLSALSGVRSTGIGALESARRVSMDGGMASGSGKKETVKKKGFLDRFLPN